ncbi:hypothetical protein RvY_10670 [Ramazzottius varieornatus]|uniref:Trans-1,2-dihydrobenzene-1,2-diol dehydrogenase n=1 Tax=Ramazzottius varieornatus TaxID=947166 RepID=A0A1D1VDI1_RAMVA|nr:hypothetical protein RvY_10670 [Ramazzottius varieornatus]
MRMTGLCVVLGVLLLGFVAAEGNVTDASTTGATVASTTGSLDGPLKWGIVAAGKISNDWAAALASLPKEEHQMVAIAARDAGRAADFAKTFNIPKSYGSYAELAKDPNVNIVYIGTIHPTHYEIVKMMLENDKHVLCEKPMTLWVNHTEELVQLAREKKKFLQEAVWSRFFPAYRTLRQVLKEEKIGEMKMVSAVMGIAMPNTPRLHRKHLGGGALMDLGSYTIQLAVAVFGNEMPETIKAVATLNNESVDTNLAMILQWKSGGIAQLSASSLVLMNNDAMIFGTNGTIKLPGHFWCPDEIVYKRTTEGLQTLKHEKREFPKIDHKTNFKHGAGMVYQAQEVHRSISNGFLESPLMTHDESILFAKIEQEVKKQIGVTYQDLYKDQKYCGENCNV